MISDFGFSIADWHERHLGFQSAITNHQSAIEGGCAPMLPAPGAPGIDISRHNGPINWPRVKRVGIQFAYLRASMGTLGLDTGFVLNWREARAAGIPYLGAYHFFDSNTPGEGQANNFLHILGEDLGQLPPAVDVEPRYNEVPSEPQRQEYTAGLRRWLDIVEAKTGVRPAIYTSFAAWPAMTTEPEWARDYPLWVANYTDAPAPRLPAPWTDYLLWQWTSSGQLYGITSARADLNLWADRRPDAGGAG